MREPTFLRARVSPNADDAKRLQERLKQVEPPPGAELIRDQTPVRRREAPLPSLLRRQAG